jgi:hypothetical protein
MSAGMQPFRSRIPNNKPKYSVAPSARHHTMGSQVFLPLRSKPLREHCMFRDLSARLHQSSARETGLAVPAYRKFSDAK